MVEENDAESYRQYTEQISFTVTPEAKQRAKKAKQEGEYTSLAEYFRSMFYVGESRLADLDPRTQSNNVEQSEISTAKDAAKALDDLVLIKELDENKQDAGKVLEQLTEDFEANLAGRLLEMANNENTVVETDGRGNYWIGSGN